MGAYASEARALYGILPDAEQSSADRATGPSTADETCVRARQEAAATRGAGVIIESTLL